MPRVRPLGKPDYDKEFGIEMNCAITKSFLSKQDVADRMGITKRMLYYRLKTPKALSLELLKLFIKVTNMDPNVILNYLYEGKYHVRTEPE